MRCEPPKYSVLSHNFVVHVQYPLEIILWNMTIKSINNNLEIIYKGDIIQRN